MRCFSLNYCWNGPIYCYKIRALIGVPIWEYSMWIMLRALQKIVVITFVGLQILMAFCGADSSTVMRLRESSCIAIEQRQALFQICHTIAFVLTIVSKCGTHLPDIFLVPNWSFRIETSVSCDMPMTSQSITPCHGFFSNFQTIYQAHSLFKNRFFRKELF